LKKFVAILALVGILLQTFSQVVILAQFYANQDYIAKHLCENRDKPQMHCNGKCCLKKKLAKEAKDQAPVPGNQKNEQVNLFFAESKIEIVHFVPLSDPIRYLSYNELQTISSSGSVFHPPTA